MSQICIRIRIKNSLKSRIRIQIRIHNEKYRIRNTALNNGFRLRLKRLILSVQVGDGGGAADAVVELEYESSARTTSQPKLNAQQ
jgi:hypothetical protein